MARVAVSSALDAEKRSRLGQYMTPASVARFMASLFSPSGVGSCRLLDPGAGMGALSAAFLERWKSGGFGFGDVSVTAFEVDPVLRGCLENTMAEAEAETGASCLITGADFVESAVDSLAGDLFARNHPPFTHAILNPPYKKIGVHSRHRHLLRRVGIETVNLYSAFTALALEMLAPRGQLVAVIPRSFCNGPYYKPFREFILGRAAIRHMHLFGARDRAFRDDGVLQENIIILLERDARQGEVTVSTSTDDGFFDCVRRTYSFNRIVAPDDPDKFIHVPTTVETGCFPASSVFNHSLADLGVYVSTGPVVDFRARSHLRHTPEDGTVPLLYPCHFGTATVEWPNDSAKKPGHLTRNNETEKLLFPNGFYTVVRRFSAKEEKRRIVANVVCPTTFESPLLGFENHLNVFHSGKCGLPEKLAWGLFVFLNSTAVDQYFRQFNGHTQVNATDLRALKYPGAGVLECLGGWAGRHRRLTQAMIDEKLKSVS